MQGDITGKSKLLVSGLPGSGKTTLIEALIGELSVPVCGFLTREIREQGARVGFRLIGLSGRVDVLAHTGMKSDRRIGKYGVDTRALERMMKSEFTKDSSCLTVIDEIGKMELLSRQFRLFISELWRTDRPVLAAIMSARNLFCDGLKADRRTVVIELNSARRDQAGARLRDLIVSLLGNQYRKEED